MIMFEDKVEKWTDEYISCRTNCPVPVKNVMLGCSGRPVKYQKECSRFKEYMKLLKKQKKRRNQNDR